jgi:hypothetical protein
MNLEFALSLQTLIVAVAALYLDHRARNRDQLRKDEMAIRDEARTAREKGLAARQYKEQSELEDHRYKHALDVQATERLSTWASRCAKALSVADHILTLDREDITRQKIELASEISALIDEGRWLFRNHSPEAYGQKKPPINRGFRDGRLDPLVATYRKLLGPDAFDPSRDRRDFTFKVQQLSLPLSAQALEERL